MKNRMQSKTAEYIRDLAQRYHVVYFETPNDLLAHHISRLAGDTVKFDDVEQLLVGLQRAGHLSRTEMVQLQAQYLREAAP